MTAAVQTIWARVVATTLADAGVTTCVISPGSRSTPLVIALAREPRLELVTLIDERAAAFFALGVARATHTPVALVCTSGSAAAHYLPAIVEASLAGVPLVALTADRPAELHACGAAQTIEQHGLYGGFVRAALDLGAPATGELALRAVRRKLVQAITAALGPRPGPVHVDVPLRKPLEPAAPASADERRLTEVAAALRSERVVAPALAADPRAIEQLVLAIAIESHGVIAAGALPIANPLRGGAASSGVAGASIANQPRAAASIANQQRSVAGMSIANEPRDAPTIANPLRDCAVAQPVTSPFGIAASATGAGAVQSSALRESIFELAARTGYPILAEAGSQLRFGPRPDGVVFVDHFDVVPAGELPAAKLVIQLGAEPVAAAWPGWLARTRPDRWNLAESWHDPDSDAHVILGELASTLAMLTARLERRAPTAPAAMWSAGWAKVESRARGALAAALEAHPGSETAALQAAIAALPDGATIQLGNSLPIRIVDHVAASPVRHAVITQRGAAGIDGLVSSAAGATRGGAPVLLVLGDVSFAHDVGGLLATRCASAPLAILVLDNAGGQIFAGLPIASADVPRAVFDQHWTTLPGIDPVAIATAFGVPALVARTPLAVAAAVAHALAAPGVTVIHAPVTPSGAHDVRRAAIERYS